MYILKHSFIAKKKILTSESSRILYLHTFIAKKNFFGFQNPNTFWFVQTFEKTITKFIAKEAFLHRKKNFKFQRHWNKLEYGFWSIWTSFFFAYSLLTNVKWILKSLKEQNTKRRRQKAQKQVQSRTAEPNWEKRKFQQKNWYQFFPCTSGHLCSIIEILEFSMMKYIIIKKTWKWN